MGCRRRTGQAELARIVAVPDHGLRVGRTLPGRGAWICAGSAACLDLAVSRNALSRALGRPVSAGEALALGPHLSG